jgi:hypothetical protein
LNKGIKATHKKFWDVERGVTYIPWSKVKMEELEGSREGGMLDADTLCPGKHLSSATSTLSALGDSQLSSLIPHLLSPRLLLKMHWRRFLVPLLSPPPPMHFEEGCE